MIVIIFLSFISKRIEKRVLFPIAFTFISIVLFFISFIIGRWEGMGMGAVSISLFVASIIALIAIVLLYKIGPNSSKNHHQY
ncbi:hypothetical protein CFK40_10550 [Virgibacillus necropolis]|uniref:YesK-like protein n=1 Tax=Virgibacillus necropolis TaxID=163877 RepID=A0A221MI96_9BACI|nr:hypothetical protein CFK40_10550 [Virgibacillus necropolis]